jgi:hypothetical protein
MSQDGSKIYVAGDGTYATVINASTMRRLSPMQMGSGYSVVAADYSKAAFEDLER